MCRFPPTGATVTNYVLYVVFVLQIIADGMCQKCDLRSCSNLWPGEGFVCVNILYLPIYCIKSSQKERNSHDFFPSSLLCCCFKVADPTWSFLQCVGLPSTDTGRGHIHRLKQILEATMDVYTFMVLE